jgi:hypothetical protein
MIEQELKVRKARNALDEAIVERIAELNSEVKTLKIRLTALEQIITRQNTAREKAPVVPNDTPEKQSWWPKWIN